MSPRSSADHDGMVFHGRGGAGNANRQTEQAPMPALGTPTLKNKTYTTGRGGTGNMAVNDPKHPELARERQDVDASHVPLAAEMNFPTGRGGVGNIHHLTEEERAEAKEQNDHLLGNSRGRGDSKDRDHIRELAEMGKEKLLGRKGAKA